MQTLIPLNSDEVLTIETLAWKEKGSFPETTVHKGKYYGMKVMAEIFPPQLAEEARAASAGLFCASDSLCVRMYGGGVWNYGEAKALVMDLVEYSVKDCVSGEGGLEPPIRFLVDNGGNEPTNEGNLLLKEVGRGLARMHGNRLVHGRLSQSSVLVTDTGEPRFSNMGACRRLGDELSAEEVARQQAEDVQAFAELCRYCWTASDRPGDLAGLWPEALEVVTAASRENRLQVPSMRLVNEFPLWWPGDHSFKLFVRVAEYLNAYRDKGDLLDAVAGHAIGGNWHTRLQDYPDLLAFLGNAYDPTSAAELLRMLENRHYSDFKLPPAVNLQLGETDGESFRFLQRHFPRLLMAVHAFALVVCDKLPRLAEYTPFPSEQFAMFDAYSQAFSALEEAQAAQDAMTG